MSKKKNTQKKPAKVPTKQKSNEFKYLSMLITKSREAMDGRGGFVDEFFAEQVSKLTQKLDNLGEK